MPWDWRRPTGLRGSFPASSALHDSSYHTKCVKHSRARLVFPRRAGTVQVISFGSLASFSILALKSLVQPSQESTKCPAKMGGKMQRKSVYPRGVDKQPKEPDQGCGLTFHKVEITGQSPGDTTGERAMSVASPPSFLQQKGPFTVKRTSLGGRILSFPVHYWWVIITQMDGKNEFFRSIKANNVGLWNWILAVGYWVGLREVHSDHQKKLGYFRFLHLTALTN